MNKINTEKIKPDIEKLAQKYHLTLVVLFGSQARGTTHAKSDVDLAFSSETNLSPYDVAKMQLEFTQRLKFKDIELVDLRNASPLLLREVTRHAIVLHEKDHSKFARLKMYAFKRFVETKPLLDLRTKAREDFVKNYVR